MGKHGPSQPSRATGLGAAALGPCVGKPAAPGQQRAFNWFAADRDGH